MVPAQRHSVAKRTDEYFAVRTGAEMPSKFGANVFWQLVVDVGRQLAKNIETTDFVRRVMMGLEGAGPSRQDFFPAHEPPSFGRQCSCGRRKSSAIPCALSSRLTNNRARCSRDFNARSLNTITAP